MSRLKAILALAALALTLVVSRAESDAQDSLRVRLSAIHAAEQATLAEGKLVLGAQHLSDLGAISQAIATGKRWEFVPDLLQIVERHRARFRDDDGAGPVEPTWAYASALNALAASGKALPYLIELAGSVRGPLWKMTVIDAIAGDRGSLKALDEPNRRALAAVVTELSTGPMGTAPTRSVLTLKEALGLTSPLERLIYAHAGKAGENEGFPAVNSIEFANRIGDGNSECHVTTLSSGGAGARHWRDRGMLWVFQSPGPAFEPTKPRLVFSGVVQDAISGTLNNSSADTTYRFFSTGHRLGNAVYWPMRRQAALNDRIEAITTTAVLKDPHDRNPSVTTNRAEYALRDGRYVLLPHAPAVLQE